MNDGREDLSSSVTEIPRGNRSKKDLMKKSSTKPAYILAAPSFPKHFCLHHLSRRVTYERGRASVIAFVSQKKKSPGLPHTYIYGA